MALFSAVSAAVPLAISNQHPEFPSNVPGSLRSSPVHVSLTLASAFREKQSTKLCIRGVSCFGLTEACVACLLGVFANPKAHELLYLQRVALDGGGAANFGSGAANLFGGGGGKMRWLRRSRVFPAALVAPHSYGAH